MRTLKMKKQLILLPLCSSACAAASLAPVHPAGDIEIAISRETFEGRPALAVRMVNMSGVSLCIRSAAIEDPYSGEINIQLRDLKHRPLSLRPRGVAPPAKDGVIRLNLKGDRAEGRYFLDSRFYLPIGNKTFLGGIEAQVAVRFGYCDDVWSKEAISRWTAI